MKNLLTAIALLVVLMTAGLATAQEPGIAAAPMADSRMLCPFPFVQHIPGGSGASTILATEFPASIRPAIAGSMWNQTHWDRAFGHTFRFEPKRGDCCALTGAILTIKIKALVGGAGPTSANDAINVYVGGVVKAARTPWTAGVHTGDLQTVTIPLTAADLSTGLVSIYVEDDTAVLSADLELDWCCLTRHP